MNINSDNVKTALLIGGVFAVGIFAFKIYSTMKTTGETFDAVTDKIANSADAFIDNAVSTTKQIFSNVAATVTGDYSAPGFEAPDFVGLVPYSKWDASTKNFVLSLQKLRGRGKGGMNEAEASGYKVYTNGTIITPLGEYFKMDYTSPAMETPDGFAASAIWYNGATNWDLETLKMPKVGGNLSDSGTYF